MKIKHLSQRKNTSFYRMFLLSAVLTGICLVEAIPFLAQNSEAGESARVARAAKERAFTQFPKGKVVRRYSLVLDLSSCSRAYGVGATPDMPWTLTEGHTWAQCYDELHMALPQTDDWLYIRESVIEDFMKGPRL